MSDAISALRFALASCTIVQCLRHAVYVLVQVLSTGEDSRHVVDVVGITAVNALPALVVGLRIGS